MTQPTKPYSGMVLATQRGYYGGAIREPGERFGVENCVVGSWMEIVGGDVPVKAPRKPREVPASEAVDVEPADFE